ncbi:PAS domain S-box protein [Deinococcus radiotolerans]|uniref:PAS domain S-box protein n=1 Tax=Deinococcus radiotolerans TaxID=1309407 RepID=UPI003570DDC9
MNGVTPLAVLEKLYLRADGEVVWSRSSVSLLPARSGAVTSVVVVADITELERAQRRLEAVNLSLQVTPRGSLLGLGDRSGSRRSRNLRAHRARGAVLRAPRSRAGP